MGIFRIQRNANRGGVARGPVLDVFEEHPSETAPMVAWIDSQDGEEVVNLRWSVLVDEPGVGVEHAGGGTSDISSELVEDVVEFVWPIGTFGVR